MKILFSYPEEEHVNEDRPLSSGRKMSVLASSLRNTDPFSKAPLILSDQELFHHEAIRLRFLHLPLPSCLHSASVVEKPLFQGP